MKALFFDIDGTLLSEITKEIPQSALDALKKTAEKGNLTFINTGRTWSELPEELKKLPFSGFLCGCGTYLRRDGEILMHQTIPKKRCEEIPVILKECRIGMILEGTDNVYFSSEVSRFREVEQTRAYFAAVGIGLAETAETKGIIYDKFCIVTDAQSDIERMYREFEQEFDIMDRRGGVYEIVPHGCSKGTAVDYALKQFQLEKEDAYVFGDSSNDLTMFRCGAHTIALGKHDELIITIAKCMRAAVGQNGQCYRIGGDEFMIILKNKTAEETEEIIRQVRAEIEFADEQSDIPISVAMGYAWTDAEEKNLPELIHCADEKMYKDKKRIKENTSSA